MTISRSERHSGPGPLRVDLNCDLGEGFGPYTFGGDETLIRLVSSANIACGFHAGDPHIMRATVELCVGAGVAVGAHPGLPDRLGFGRRFLDASPDEIFDYVVYQTAALEGFVRAAGCRLRHVKPHGALYHMANRDADSALAVVRAVRAVDPRLLVYAQAGSLLLRQAEAAGLAAASEAFADRRYRADGSLVPRGQAGALIGDEAEAVRQAVSLAVRGEAVDETGSIVRVKADTICIHGDGRSAAALTASVRSALLGHNVEIGLPHRFL